MFIYLIFLVTCGLVQGQHHGGTSLTVFCIFHGRGVFPDPQTEYTTCKDFIFCINQNGLIYSERYTCDAFMIFDPNSETCVYYDEYDCPRLPSSSSSSSSTSSSSYTGEGSPSTTPGSSFCDVNGEGIFPDPESTNCKTYIRCIPYNGNINEQIYTCPGSTIYKPSASQCVDSGYTCPASEPTTVTSAPPSPPTTQSMPTTTVSANNYCYGMEVGYYPDPATEKTTCATYIRCINNAGTITGQRYTCPGTTIYNPATKKCVVSGYVCPKG